MVNLILNKKIEIEKYQNDTSRYFVELKDLNTRIVVTQPILDLLKVIEKFPKLDIDGLCNKYNQIHNKQIKKNDISESVNLLLKNGIILSSDYEATKRKNKYLKIKVSIINARLVHILSQPLHEFRLHKFYTLN